MNNSAPWYGKVSGIFSFLAAVFFFFLGITSLIGAVGFSTADFSSECTAWQIETGTCEPNLGSSLTKFSTVIAVVMLALGVFYFFIANGFFKGKHWTVIASLVLSSGGLIQNGANYIWVSFRRRMRLLI